MEGTFFSCLVSYFYSRANRKSKGSDENRISTLWVDEGIVFHLPENYQKISHCWNSYIGRGKSCISTSHSEYIDSNIKSLSDLNGLYQDYFIAWMHGVSFQDYFFVKIDKLYYGFFYDEFETNNNQLLTLVKMVLIQEKLYISTIITPKTKKSIRDYFMAIYYEDYLFDVIPDVYSIGDQISLNQQDF